MDSAVDVVIPRQGVSARRVRPGSVIASRMMVFEAAVQQQSRENGRDGEDEAERPCRPLLKASSMADLTGRTGGWSLPKATPPAEPSGVVCNPSTGQAIPRISSTSCLITCIRATTAGGSTHKPHPPYTPVRVGSTSSTDSDYSTGSQHSFPRDEDPPNLDPPDDPLQASPTTGTRGVIGNLKHLFESPHHSPLSRATSLPQITPSPLTPSPHTPPPQRHKVALVPKRPQLGPKPSTLPMPSCLRQPSGGPPRGDRQQKAPLMPPTVKQVRIFEPHPQRNDCSDGTKSAMQIPRKIPLKIPLLPPVAPRTPAVRCSPRSPSSEVPPPKPPRAPNRLQLHNMQQYQVCVDVCLKEL